MAKDPNAFDVVVLGTGITESIVASSLAKAGWKVAHVDTNPFYGGNEATFNIQELSQWLGDRTSVLRPGSGTTHGGAEWTSSEIKKPRDYSISLTPTVIPATGPFISCLISSGVARYGSFKLLDRILIYSSANDSLRPVPGSKEDIFKSQDLTLVDKRKLMRFLVFASGDYEGSTQLEGKEEMPFSQFLSEVFTLDDRLATQLSTALSFSFSKAEPTKSALARIHQYVRSTGRYGNSPFLIGHYGGLGELVQGFCRICAVAGGTYIISRQLNPIQTSNVSPDETSTPEEPHFKLTIEDISDSISSNLIITSPDHLKYLPSEWVTADQTVSTNVSRTYSVAIVIAEPSGESTSSESSEEDEVPKHTDSSVLFFLPGDLPDGHAEEAVCVLTYGDGTNSCLEGQVVLYVSTPTKSTPESSKVQPNQLLRPYIDATLRLLSGRHQLKSIFSAFYARSTTPIPQHLTESLHTRRVLVTQPLDSHVATVSDAAATEAESIFWSAVKLLKEPEIGTPTTMWPPLIDDDDDDD